MIDFFKNNYNSLNQNHPVKMKIFRYIISGSIAAIVNLFFLYLFTEMFGVWYVISAMISFLISFVVSFSLQKFWTFENRAVDQIRGQILFYFIITVINLGINTSGIFLLVDYVQIHYLIAQIIISALIAIESFVVYHFVFKDKVERVDLIVN